MRTVTVMDWNARMHHRDFDPEACAAFIASTGAEVVLLQEALHRRGVERIVPYLRELWRRPVFRRHRAYHRVGADPFGVAVLSKAVIALGHVRPAAPAFNEPRAMYVTRTAGLDVCVAHLSSGAAWEHHNQVPALERFARDVDVLGVDTNLQATEPRPYPGPLFMTDLLERFNETQGPDAVTFPKNDSRIDYLLTRQLCPGRVHKTTASDHYALTARVPTR